MVLGSTIRRLKQEMTNAEFISWCAYRFKYGPFNFVRRYDRPAALVAAMQSSNKTQADFMPWPIPLEIMGDDGDLTPEQETAALFAEFGLAAPQ